jgi:outer membrane protein TolC
VLSRLIAAAVLCAAPATIQAQRADTLDLTRAVALARAANPMLAARAAEVRAAGARIRPAGALSDPTLTLGAMNYMLPGLSPRGDPMTMNQVTLMQTVPVNGTLGLRRSVARSDSARFAYVAEAAALEVEAAVRAQYWALYHDDRALELMARRRAVLQEIVTVATTMYSTGAATQSDALRGQVAITRLDQEVAEMRLERYAAAAALNALLGRPGQTGIALPVADAHEHGIMMHTLDMPEPPALESLIAAADAHSPDILGAGARVAGGRTNAAAVRRALIPDLGIGVAYGQRAGLGDMLSLMVSVNVPVFAASRQLRQRDEAAAMLDAATWEQAAVRVQVHAALATARQQAMTARRLVALYAGTLVPQAEAAYQAALAAYRVGRVDFATLLDAQTAVLEYEHDLHIDEAMYGTAVAELDRLTGRRFDAGNAGREN